MCEQAMLSGVAVAIPLGQGQVFNEAMELTFEASERRNPFGSGTGF